MDYSFSIDGRTYDKIAAFCKSCGLDVERYIHNAICERIDVDIYGDLNKKVSKNTESCIDIGGDLTKVENPSSKAVIEKKKTKTAKNNEHQIAEKEELIKQNANEDEKTTKRRTITTKR